MVSPSDVLDALAQYRDSQLEQWPLAKSNYDALARCKRRIFKLGRFEGALQFNPERKVSTGAKVDKATIRQRPCFLCRSNRPKEQFSEPLMDGWEFLINPYPILPLHFTIASVNHVPQSKIPLDMAAMAEKLPGMVIFYNGAKAGASAPDHMHCQAVMAAELPLIRFLENGGDPKDLPYKVVYRKITPDVEGMINLNSMVAIMGKDAVTGKDDPDLINAFFWLGNDGMLRIAIVPRKAHRPSNYTSETDGDGIMVSPGAIDMAGLLVLPREKDFESITTEDIAEVYSQTAWHTDN